MFKIHNKTTWHVKFPFLSHSTTEVSFSFSFTTRNLLALLDQAEYKMCVTKEPGAWYMTSPRLAHPVDLVVEHTASVGKVLFLILTKDSDNFCPNLATSGFNIFLYCSVLLFLRLQFYETVEKFSSYNIMRS